MLCRYMFDDPNRIRLDKETMTSSARAKRLVAHPFTVRGRVLLPYSEPYKIL